MIALLTVDGLSMPLTQATLRRSADAADLSFKLNGLQAVSVGAGIVLTVGAAVVSGVVDSVSINAASTDCTATVTPATGAGTYAPAHIHYRSNGMIRADVDFAVLPGDTHAGMIIKTLTHALGTSSPAFTEARF